MGELGQPGLGKEPEEVCRLSQLWEGEGGGTPSRRDHLQSPDVGGLLGDSVWNFSGN